jgi:hypothetical protein
MKRAIIAVFCSCLAASVVLAGCGRKAMPKDRAIATVNGENVYVKDFSRALSLSLKRDPMYRITPQTFEDEVNLLVDKKLLLQEAKKKKLDQTDKFTNTIKNFWEQTLIRDLMASKDAEFGKHLTVTDAELKEYYGKAAHQKTFKVLKSRDKQKVVSALAADPSKVEWEETVGPVSYFDVATDVLKDAFEVPQGRMRIVKADTMYYLFYVERDDMIPMAPLGDISEQLKAKIINVKKEAVYRKWLSDLRKKADIKMNPDVVKGLRYGTGRDE